MIGAEDYSKTTAVAPSCQFREIHTVYDLHLTASNIPDTIGVGQNLHVTAEVGEYEAQSCLFLLSDPLDKVAGARAL